MYVSLSRLRVPESRADELVAAFRRRAGLVDAFEGFVDLQVWQNDRDPGELTMVSRWRDRECFRPLRPRVPGRGRALRPRRLAGLVPP